MGFNSGFKGLMVVQEVRWDKRATVRAGNYNFFYEKENENYQLGTGYFVHHRIVSAVKRVEFVSDRKSYIVLRGRWCNIIVLNVPATSEGKSYGSKGSFTGNYSSFFYHFPKYYTKILLGDIHAKVGRQNTFKPTFGNESLHQDSNDNGVRIVKFATSENLVVKNTMFPHRNIHMYNWTSPDGKAHNQTDHILIDMR